MSVEACEVLTINGWKNTDSLQQNVDLVLNININHHSYTYDYITQHLSYCSHLFFRNYTNVYLDSLKVCESIRTCPTHFQHLQLEPKHTNDIISCLSQVTGEYIPEMYGTTFTNIPIASADNIQHLACLDGVLCIIAVTDFINQMCEVNFVEEGEPNIDFEWKEIAPGSTFSSVSISTANGYNNFVFRKLNPTTFTYIPFLVCQ